MPIALIALLVAGVLAVTGFFVLKETDTPQITPESADNNETETIATTETNRPNIFTETIPTPTEPLPATDPAVSQVVDDIPAAPAATTNYSDGIYTASASYFTPARKEHDIDVTLTIADDTITNATVIYDGGSASSGSHKRFDEAYEAVVVGATIDSLNLSRVGGASLTTDAFNEALSSIKSEAS